MLSRWLRQKNGPVVGLEVTETSISVVVKEESDSVPCITQVLVINHENTEETTAHLKRWVHDNKLTKAPCNIVLSQGDYQMMLVESPEVDPAELRNAVRWKLKELLTIPVEHAAIDVFSLPEDGSRSKQKMVYVVAVESAKIQALVDLASEIGLQLKSIDISELAIRNIAQSLVCDDGGERGIAFARLQRSSGTICIYRQGNMYLARTFALDYNGGLFDDLPEESLALELQRSLDYYERQMGQSPPSVVYLCGEHVNDDKVGEVLKSSLAIPLQVLDPGAIALLSKQVEPRDLNLALGALGGAFRLQEAV